MTSPGYYSNLRFVRSCCSRWNVPTAETKTAWSPLRKRNKARLKAADAEDNVGDEESSDEFSVEWADSDKAGGGIEAAETTTREQDENRLLGNTKRVLDEGECPAADGDAVATTPAPSATVVSVPDATDSGHVGMAPITVAAAAAASAARMFKEDGRGAGDELTQPLLESTSSAPRS